MSTLKARVENGRLRLDEPTDLPEGTEVEVELVIVGGDELNEEERARLHASLDRALDDEDASRFVDTDDFLAEVRAET
jgi:predicted DNA-binding antitoxin AbrB/MazE fold protein